MPETFLMSLFADRGEIIAGVAAGLILIVGIVGKKLNWFAGADGAPGKADLSDKVTAIDKRLQQVEIDIEHLPTRQEFHQMALQLSQLEGHVRMVERTSTATGHAVGRIEDHFIRMSGGK